MPADPNLCPSSPSAAALRNPRWLLLVCTGGALLVDQLIKAQVQQHLRLAQPWPLIPGWLQLTYVENSGVAFSLFSHLPAWVLVTFALTLLGVLVGGAWLRPGMARWEAIAFGLLIGGALGNILDRARMGRVIDYIDWVGIGFPVFNAADICICVGVGLLVLGHLLAARRGAAPESQRS
jgi:signal peptidase II